MRLIRLNFIRPQTRLFLYAIMLLPASLASAEAQDWPEFRGPEGRGIAEGHQFPTDNLHRHIAWQVPIHGKGWSSPVVQAGQVWLTTATEDGTKMSTICVDLKTGKKLLDRVIHENKSPDFCHPTNSYASCTPVVESGRVYLHFGKYGTTCLDTQTFETLWQRTDFPCDHFRGPASSPILSGDLLIVAFDGADRQYVVGLNKRTGETVWKTDRNIDYGTDNGDSKKAYGTGTVFSVNDQPLLVLPSAVATIAYRPTTGEEVWKVYHGGMNASARVQPTADGNLLITNGMGKMVAVKPEGSGDITDSGIAWRLSRGVARKSTPLVIGDRFFMINDQGIASWYDAATGEAIWQQRVGGSFSASPVFDGSSIFVCSEQGEVLAFAPTDEFQQLGTSKLGAGFKATPALTGARMVLRSFDQLIAVEATPK